MVFCTSGGIFVLYLSCISLNASSSELTVMHLSSFKKPSLSSCSLVAASSVFLEDCFCAGAAAAVGATVAEVERSALFAAGGRLAFSAFADFLSSILDLQFNRLPLYVYTGVL